MKIIFALGNPGEKYLFTRHNAGFIAIDYIASKQNAVFEFSSRFESQIAKTIIEDESVLLVKPQTFMNLSGIALEKIMKFYKVEKKDILVVYDDISLDLGTLRFRNKGESGGHNGVKSIIEHLSNDNNFLRLKIGIGPQVFKSETYVLQNFSNEQLEKLKELLPTIFQACKFSIKGDFVSLQNKFNKSFNL